MQFADVKNDVAFRKIFGNENRTESLISFLNAVLGFEGNDIIESVKIVNPFQLPSLRGGKVTIVDVKATDKLKRQFIVEMQVADKEGFSKRVLYYTAKSYTSQIRRGEQYQKLKPAFFIGVLNFVHTENVHYISRSRIQDIETGEVTIKDIEFNFIELPKFQLDESALNTLTEKWVYFLKNAENLEVIPENTNDKGLKLAYQEANQHTWTQQELDAYDYAFMREEDARAEMAMAQRKALESGLKQGIEQGIEQGLQQGLEQGIEKGVQQGIEKNKIEVAQNAIIEGLSNAIIAKLTGLSIIQIEELRQ